MSGFAGIVSLDGAPADAQLLQRMAERLAFRGPDGTHITTKPGAGFCFTFLRTGPAPQCPSQPCSLDGNVWLLGDVRLDGRDDLRRKLEQHGDQFDGEVTDEELVLRAWRRWGEDALAEFIGDYAFAIWDGVASQLWCARDLMGARPLFYARAGKHLYFTNTLNAIRCAPEITTAVDEHFIGDFLLQGWCADLGRSAFRDISRVPPGYVLRYANREMGAHRFTSLADAEPLQLKSEEEIVEQFSSLLQTAVLERLPHGPTAIFMSGGLDSTTIAAFAVHVAKTRQLCLDLRAYTVACEPFLRDEEGRLASLVAEHIGISIQLQQGTSCLPFQNLDHPAVCAPEPLTDPYRFLYLEQVSSIAKHACVALNGYGGDGIMTGQAWPYLVYLARGLHLGTIGRRFGGYFLRHGVIPPLRGGFRSGIQRLLGIKSVDANYPAWLGKNFERRIQLRDRWRELTRPRENVHQWYPDAADSSNAGLWATVLESEDASWTQIAVESRAPLLDMRLHRFLLSVPPVPLCINKELLRMAARNFLPEAICIRRKSIFQGDLMEYQIRSNQWNPLPLPKPNELVAEFVDWPRLQRAIESAQDGALWRDLHPVSLLYWFESMRG